MNENILNDILFFRNFTLEELDFLSLNDKKELVKKDNPTDKQIQLALDLKIPIHYQSKKQLSKEIDQKINPKKIKRIKCRKCYGTRRFPIGKNSVCNRCNGKGKEIL